MSDFRLQEKVYELLESAQTPFAERDDDMESMDSNSSDPSTDTAQEGSAVRALNSHRTAELRRRASHDVARKDPSSANEKEAPTEVKPLLSSKTRADEAEFFHDGEVPPGELGEPASRTRAHV